MSAVHDLLVVGAGMSGLAHAWWAHLAGSDVQVLEAGARVGGVIDTVTTNGYRHERAATSVPSTARNLSALLASLPEPPRLVAASAAKRQWLLGPRGLVAVPRSPPQLLRSPLLPVGAKARLALELLLGPRRVARGETLHRFVRRRLGRSVADNLLRPFVRGIHGVSPERLGAADAFPALVALEARRGGLLRGMLAQRGAARREVLVPEAGMASLPHALSAALGARVRLSTPVAAIEPAGPGHAAGVRLSDGTVVRAHEVALAVPAAAQARLLAPHVPHAADLLASVAYSPIAVAAVGWRRAHGPAVPEGFGFLRGARARTRLLGATFNARLLSAVAPEDGELVTCYLGGSEDPAALELSDGALVGLVLRDLGAALGGLLRPEVVALWRHPAAIPVFAPGHRGRMARAAAAAGDRGFRLLGSHVTGVSLEDCCRPLAPLRAPLVPGLTRQPW